MGAGPEVKKKTFAEIFVVSKVFKPNPPEIIVEEENKLFSDDIISWIPLQDPSLLKK